MLLEPPGDLPRAKPFVRERLDGSDQPDLRRQAHGDEERLDALLELRFARGKDLTDVAAPPRVRQGPGGGVVQRHGKLLDLSRADLLAARPRRELLDLLLEKRDVVAGDLDQAAGSVVRRLRAEPCELAPHPDGRVLRLGHVVGEHLAASTGDQLGERVVLRRLLHDKREHGSAHRVGEVGVERLRVGLLPFFDTLDHDQPPRTEQAEGVQRCSRILAGSCLRTQDLDRLVAEPRPEAAEGAADLGAIGSGEEVDRAQLVGHRG